MPERFADAEIDGLLRPHGNAGPAARCPRFVEAGVEKLVQIPMDDPITRGCHERMGKARANRAERRPDADPVAAKAQAATAILVAIEPAVTDIRHQENSRLLFGTGLKRMRLPGVDRYGRGFVDQMRNIRNCHDRRGAAEMESQMTFAVGVTCASAYPAGTLSRGRMIHDRPPMRCSCYASLRAAYCFVGLNDGWATLTSSRLRHLNGPRRATFRRPSPEESDWQTRRLAWRMTGAGLWHPPARCYDLTLGRGRGDAQIPRKNA